MRTDSVDVDAYDDPIFLDNFLARLFLVHLVSESPAIGIQQQFQGVRQGDNFGPAVTARCGETLAPFKTPKQVIFTDVLPKNERGKLDRKALTEAWKKENAAVVEGVVAKFSAKKQQLAFSTLPGNAFRFIICSDSLGAAASSSA